MLPVELEDDGLLVVLFSVLDEADELLPFELSVLLLSVLHSVSLWVCTRGARTCSWFAARIVLFRYRAAYRTGCGALRYGAFGIAARTRRKRNHKRRRHQYCCDLFLHSRSLLI